MNENDRVPGERTFAQGSERKLLGAVIVLGVFALVFGFLQLGNSIQKPFAGTTLNNANRLGSAGTALSTLTKRDTDNDGLTDFDELYTYQTSPYLDDSDSDGTSDAQEVSEGTNPNCGQGTTCTPLSLTGNTNAAATNASTNATTNGASNAAATNIAAGLPSGSLSANELRVALRDAGAPETTLQAMTDQEILDLYNQVISEQGGTSTNASTSGSAPGEAGSGSAGNTNAATNAPVNAVTSADRAALEAMTPAQIRDFLVKGGADATVLEQIDDATLRSIFSEAIKDL